MPISFASFKHLKLPISTKIHCTCQLFIFTAISPFDFMNFAFAKLLLAGLLDQWNFPKSLIQLRMVHYKYGGVTDFNLLKNCYSSQHVILCGISSWSSGFVIVPVRGFQSSDLIMATWL